MHRLHPWTVGYKQAVEIQRWLRNCVEIIPLFKEPRLVAGADVSIDSRAKRMYAAVVVLTWPQLLLVEHATTSKPIKFPYIPGFLSFREGPVLVEAFKKVRSKVDLWFFDGQGLAHPRGLGIATHLGLWLDCPTIGCAKSKLIGDYRKPGREKGSYSRLVYKRKTIGAVLRTRTRVKPVFISIGHKITLEQAIKFVLTASPKYRIPEPIRQAHILCNSLKSQIHTNSKRIYTNI